MNKITFNVLQSYVLLILYKIKRHKKGDKRMVNLLKPTGYVMHERVQHSRILRSEHTVFVCFVFISEQTATCATCNINCLVFITEMKSVYSAVRTGSLNEAVYASSLNI